jgi:hypothetical protein
LTGRDKIFTFRDIAFGCANDSSDQQRLPDTFAEVARSVGLDPPAIRKAKLPLTAIERPDLRRRPSVRWMLEISAAESGVESFGLRMAGRGGLADPGPVALVVHKALENTLALPLVHHDGMGLKSERHEDPVIVTPPPGPAGRACRRHVLTGRSCVRQLFSE